MPTLSDQRSMATTLGLQRTDDKYRSSNESSGALGQFAGVTRVRVATRLLSFRGEEAKVGFLQPLCPGSILTTGKRGKLTARGCVGFYGYCLLRLGGETQISDGSPHLPIYGFRSRCGIQHAQVATAWMCSLRAANKPFLRGVDMWFFFVREPWALLRREPKNVRNC